MQSVKSGGGAKALCGNPLRDPVELEALDLVREEWRARVTELESQLEDLQNRLKAIEDRMGPYEEEFA
jgi:hypothetical protein